MLSQGIEPSTSDGDANVLPQGFFVALTFPIYNNYPHKIIYKLVRGTYAKNPSGNNEKTKESTG